ncbi:hypothetical protein C8R45DRAFT_943133 [Mycena sanguinolenta]|nr:hypothetical protein C8R45DRAFT_943133 [Mycena sanguinolenta]
MVIGGNIPTDLLTTKFAACDLVNLLNSSSSPGQRPSTGSIEVAGIITLADIRSFKIQGFKELGETKPTRTVQAVFALVGDILITVALCWRLNSSKGGLQSTNKVLNYLIITAINRGVLTMISAALNLILFSTESGTFYFMLWILLGGKFYMNSMLATLNTRGYAVGMMGTNMDLALTTIKLAHPGHTTNSSGMTTQSQNRSADPEYTLFLLPWHDTDS